jgi:hypothetical protein
MNSKKSVKITVIKGSFIKKVTTLSLLAISLTLTCVQNSLTPAVAAICSGPARNLYDLDKAFSSDQYQPMATIMGRSTS